MNAFPIPYSGQSPNDELLRAKRLLAVLSVATSAAGNKDRDLDYHTVANVLDDAIDIIEPVLAFLDDLDVKGMDTQFAECRRQWVLAKGGAK